MRVFVAGGTGVVGRRLVPQLVARGHQVTATTTSAAKLGLLEHLGADAVVMDGLDAVSVGEAVAEARPDAIVHQMTAIGGKPDVKHMDRWFATTNRLRTEGTDHLLAVAEATGVSNFVAQSFNLRPILLLAVGLVLMTTIVVAAVAHWVAGLPWGAGFVKGAIVSATDAVAATAVAECLGLPHHVVVVLSGESLVNDATVLAVLGVAVAAVVEGVFSFGEAVFEFVVGGLGGLVVGLAVGWVLVRLLRFLPDPVLANAAVLLFPFASYLAAEELHVSGILAVVATGLYAGRKAPTAVSGRTRLQGNLFWEMAVFLLNGFVFVLIGLQLRDILEGLSGYSVAELALYAVLVSLAVVLTRVFWVFPATYVPRVVCRRVRERDPAPPWQPVSVIAWCGMRGVISLAAALSLPLVTAEGGPFPGRDLILFLTFSVILATLVLQGLSLPTMIRALGLEDDGSIEREEVRARVKAAEAALSRVDELSLEDWVREDTAERVRALYDYRRRRFSSRYDKDGSGGDDREDPFGNRGREDYEVRAVAYQRLMYELFRAQREALVRLRDEGEISDEALHRIERDLDLEESRLEI